MRRLSPAPSVAALLALAAAPALAQSTIPVPPISRWDSLARLAYKPTYRPRSVWVERARTLGANGTCTFKPDGTGTVRLSVPFVVLLGPTGTVQDAQAAYPECPALAALVEQFGHALGPTLLLPPAGDPPFWRASHFYAGWGE